MSRIPCRHLAGIVGLICVVSPVAVPAQQVRLNNPYHQLNDSFYENIGMNWGIGSRNGGFGNGGWFFRNGANGALPPFGGYAPGSDATFGFGGSANGNPFFFNLTAGQGSSRSMVMQSPSIVLPNGGSGGMFSGSQRPFVTGIIPVVGADAPGWPGVLAQPPAISPLQQRLEMLKQQSAEGGSSPRRERRTADRAVAAEADLDDDAPLVLGAKPAAEAGAAIGRTGGGGGGAGGADSTANHGDLSVAEIRQQQAAEDAVRDQELRDRLAKARSYEAAGKNGIAKIYYQQAAARASGELKQQLQVKIQSLK